MTLSLFRSRLAKENYGYGRFSDCSKRAGEALFHAASAQNRVASGHRAFGADLASDPPCFCFERTDSEVGACLAVGEVLVHERLQTTASFALGHVNQLMQK